MTSGGTPTTRDRASAAIVGAAVGNALGWRLDQSSRNTSRAKRSTAAQFKAWRRAVGSRKNKYIEPIEAGAFNGTISVSLGVARSLMSTDWYEDLARCQFPTLAETARGLHDYDLLSLRSWAIAVPPWQSEDPATVSSYHSNRSASSSIHALPMAVRSALSGDPGEPLAADVSRVVSLTHGHADAHVAAITLANSLRWLLLLDRTLGYGELLAVVASQVEGWLEQPRERFLEQRHNAELDSAGKQWAAATRRIVELAVMGAEQLEASAFEQIDYLGALAPPDPGGIETVAGAIYVFSKDVANPPGALAEATSALVWNTTDGAAAIGALLGSIGGTESLGRLDHDVQDRPYLGEIASNLAGNERPASTTPGTVVQPIRPILESLDDPNPPERLPDGRRLALLATTELGGTAKGRIAVQRRIALGEPPSETMDIVTVEDKPDLAPILLTSPEIVIGLPVDNIETTRSFYERIGLSAIEVTDAKLQLTDGIVFYKGIKADSSSSGADPERIVVYVDEPEILSLPQRKYQDPDGRIVNFRPRTAETQRGTTPTHAKARKTQAPKVAIRPVFIPDITNPGYPVRDVDIEFEFFSGFSVAQKQKSIRSLHQAALSLGHGPMLEISTKSLIHDGVQLSAFNLTLEIDDRGPLPLEAIFQGGKVFEHGGPFKDLYDKRPKDAKKDPRLKDSGPLIAFEFSGETWPLDPKTAFYDYLYLLALSHRPNLAERLLSYRAFTDIEFNPKKSINCQARSAALYVALENRGVLLSALRGQAAFLDAIGGSGGHEPEQLALTPP